jgi:tRNA threonylcarbamoyl adenosine modification protein (Sua5/YciO/YrdC/YwlC family)
MAQDIDLKSGELLGHVAVAAKAIRDGYLIAIPLEHHYAYACDAFNQDAVRAMHVLRRDELGIAAQVLIADAKTASGVAREISPSAQALMKKFWPGMLSLNLHPQVGLSWDLGDAGALDQVSFRVPKSKFIHEVLKETGPLAIASAAFAKQSPIRRISDIFVLESALAAKFDAGLLKKGALSTVLEADNGGITMVRQGAISLDEIHAIAPEVSRQLS